MPIVAGRMASGYSPVYRERELTEPVELCDARGNVNPAALGWSRRPVVTANLRGHWPRKKRWNFWNWISPEAVLSLTVADIDIASFCAVAFIDFETGQSIERMDVRRSGFTVLPRHVDGGVIWQSGAMTCAIGDGDVAIECGDVQGVPLRADFAMQAPRDHESLNVVVPWSARRFQLNSKHNTLPCTGSLRVGDRRYTLQPETWHGVQDWGRGIWPYRSFWNWAVCTGVQDGVAVGVNMGGKWTTGTGANENGILLDGRLHKVMEDLEWTYDLADTRAVWRVRAPHSGAIDLSLTPLHAKKVGLDLGLLATGGTCVFGRWHGVVRAADREICIDGLLGWAEEFAHRW